jgi:hypothetical protein
VEVLERLNLRYGERDAQLLVSFAAHWNGCSYCSSGHLLASNLIRYRDEGVIFPIDVDEAAQMRSMPDMEVIERIRVLLADAAYARTVALLLRQYALKAGTAQGKMDDDLLLRTTSAAWDLMNEFSITLGIDIDPSDVPALAPVGRDEALRRRYEEARKAAFASRRGLSGR